MHTKGFGGSIALGTKMVNLKSNMVYGLSDVVKFYDKKDDNSSESAEVKTIALPVFAPNIAYSRQDKPETSGRRRSSRNLLMLPSGCSLIAKIPPD